MFHQVELPVWLRTPPAETLWGRTLGAVRGGRDWLTSQLPRARRIALRALLVVAAIPILGITLVWQHVHHDRSHVPDIEPMVRFEPPTTGQVYDARGDWPSGAGA